MIGVRLAYSAPGKGRERETHVEAHKAFLRDGELNVLRSGPFFDEVRAQVGALLVVTTTSLKEMRIICSKDPFVIHGVYTEVIYNEWRPTLGDEMQQYSLS